MLNKWFADWHWANSVTDPVPFLFCQTSYVNLLLQLIYLAGVQLKSL